MKRVRVCLPTENERLKIWLAMIRERRNGSNLPDEFYPTPFQWPDRPQDEEGALKNS